MPYYSKTNLKLIFLKAYKSRLKKKIKDQSMLKDEDTNLYW